MFPVNLHKQGFPGGVGSDINESQATCANKLMTKNTFCFKCC